MAGHKPWWLPLLLAGLISLGSTLYIEYTHNDKVNANRITALESHRTDDSSRLDHIQNQVDKLVEWALGHK